METRNLGIIFAISFLNFSWFHIVLCEPPCPRQCVCERLETPRGATSVSCVGADLQELPVELERIVNLRTVNLSKNSFTAVPEELHLSVVKVDLRNNKITSIQSEGFNSLYNIEELYLDHNQVSSIKTTDFTHFRSHDQTLPYLRKLGLSHNRIKSYEEAPFRSLPSLKAVTLSHNELVEVTASLFHGVTVLELIDLSHNRIASIEEGTFKKLPGLKYVYLGWNQITSYPGQMPMMDWLDLSHNSIQYIEEEQKDDVYPVEMLNLAHNPLICDCKTRWLKELYDRREYVLKYINIPTWEFVPRCTAPPNLAGEAWDVLGDDVFVCETQDDEVNDGFLDDLGSFMSKDPDVDDLKKFGAKDKTVQEQKEYDYIVNVMTSVVTVGDTTATVKWVLDDPDGLCKKLYVQYYQIGSKDSTLLIAPVSTQLTSYVMNHLESETQYKCCVLPATSKSEVPSSIVSPLQCVQFVTGAAEREKFGGEINKKFTWTVPDSEEIAAYSKLIGFSFLVSVLITGSCLFFYEVVIYCYRLLFYTGGKNVKGTVVKSHTD